MKKQEIRAVFDDSTITVYQAYNKYIATAAVKAQTFVPPFKTDRMTWIKPSLLWMMYRSGWATKENQDITEKCHTIHQLIRNKNPDAAKPLLPVKKIFTPT